MTPAAVHDVDVPEAGTEATPALRGSVARSPWQIAWRRLRRDRVAIAGAVFVVLLVLFAAAAPLFESVTGHGLNEQDTINGLDENGVPVFPGVNGYPLGADRNGQDMLVRVAFGARTSLLVGFIATVITLFVSLAFGLLAGFYGGWVDNAISRLIDVIAAFPFLLFAVAMSVAFGASVLTVIGIIAFFSWYYPARIFRSDILALREREFVDAARMVGASNWRIMRTHLLPHLVGPLIVYSTLFIASAINFEAALSFLGFGLPPDQASWGRMIGDATEGGLYRNDPWLMLVPGTLLFMTVLAFNLLGDGLRDALDPRGGGGR
jgi:peptide/nickel transport system permease protein